MRHIDLVAAGYARHSAPGPFPDSWVSVCRKSECQTSFPHSQRRRWWHPPRNEPRALAVSTLFLL